MHIRPSTSDVDRLAVVLAKQQAAFRREGPPSAGVRRERIDRLVALLTSTADELSRALEADFGSRPHAVSRMSDICGVLPDIAYTRARLASWMKRDRVWGSGLVGLPTVVDKVPVGVVGVIGPWNFPVALVAQPTAAALAAGNRVMIKFSDLTPRTADVFSRRAAEHFPDDELAVITGGRDVARAFSELPFDHIFFTGSPSVGSLVAQAAAKNLVPVTLELGGKNPAIVARDARLKRAAERIMAARMANGGQVCLCPDEVYVPSESLQRFVTYAANEARRIASAAGEGDLVSIINDQHFHRVARLLDDASAKGAEVHEALPPDAHLRARARRQITPTVLTGVNDDMAIAHEEIFGPVLVVHAYDSLDAVTARIGRAPAPLAAYWFGRPGAEYKAFRCKSTSGGLTVNDFAAHNGVLGAPFGGVGQSGYGAYHGKAGFDTFTHHRTITRSRLPMSLGRMLTPPYSSVAIRLTDAYIQATGRGARRRLNARDDQRWRCG